MDRKQHDATSLAPPWFFWPLLSLGIALVAFITASFVVFLFHMPPTLALRVDATLGALVVGLPAWVWCIALPRRATLRRGIAVGAIASLFAYPVMWMFAGLLNRQEVFGPLQIDVVSLMILWTILGWIYAGWITTPVGAVAGGLLVLLQRVLTSAAQAHAPDSRGAATTRGDTL